MTKKKPTIIKSVYYAPVSAGVVLHMNITPDSVECNVHVHANIHPVFKEKTKGSFVLGEQTNIPLLAGGKDVDTVVLETINTFHMAIFNQPLVWEINPLNHIRINKELPGRQLDITILMDNVSVPYPWTIPWKTPDILCKDDGGVRAEVHAAIMENLLERFDMCTTTTIPYGHRNGMGAQLPGQVRFNPDYQPQRVSDKRDNMSHSQRADQATDLDTTFWSPGDPRFGNGTRRYLDTYRRRGPSKDTMCPFTKVIGLVTVYEYWGAETALKFIPKLQVGNLGTFIVTLKERKCMHPQWLQIAKHVERFVDDVQKLLKDQLLLEDHTLFYKKLRHVSAAMVSGIHNLGALEWLGEQVEAILTDMGLYVGQLLPFPAFEDSNTLVGKIAGDRLRTLLASEQSLEAVSPVDDGKPKQI